MLLVMCVLLLLFGVFVDVCVVVYDIRVVGGIDMIIVVVIVGVVDFVVDAVVM